MKIGLAAVLVAILAIAGCGTGSSSSEDVDNVAVLVVDNFKLTPRLPDAASNANCAHTSLGTNTKGANEVGGTGAGDGLPPDVAHGEAVYSELKEELSNLLPGDSAVSSADLGKFGLGDSAVRSSTGVVDKSMFRWQYKGKNILLIGVDTDGYTTATINSHLKSLIETLSGNQLVPFKRVVVNMSFVVAPCNIRKWMADYGDNPDSTDWFNAYRAKVYGDPDLKDLQTTINDYATKTDPLAAVSADPKFAFVTLRLNIDRFYRLFIANPTAADLTAVDMQKAATEAKEGATVLGKAYKQIATDPLNDPTNGVAASAAPKSVRTVVVGAAGNGVVLPTPDNKDGRHFALPFPFAPAIWENVLSVAASTGITSDDKPEAYSNNGEIRMFGNYTMTVPAPSGAPTAYPMRGTSFAAPRMSALEAVYLLTGGVIPCGGTPPLGYATDAVLNSPNWRSNWQSLSYDEAKQACSSFRTRTTLQGPFPSAT